MVENTDEEIAVAVQQGDTDRFGLLVDRYEEKMKRYSRKFLLGYEDAEDVVQEVFIKAYINIQSFDTSRRFSPWLYRIAHNEYINMIRKKGREPLQFFDPDTLFPHPLSTEPADRDANARQMRELLDRCLDRLSPKYREVLVLYYFEELNYKEIAEVLQVPVTTVGVRLKRARASLEKKVRELNSDVAYG